jgi:hypothetical protein
VTGQSARPPMSLLSHACEVGVAQLAVRTDALDSTRERDVRGRRAVEPDEDDGMGTVWAVIQASTIGLWLRRYAVAGSLPSGARRVERAENYALTRGSRRMEVSQRPHTVRA